MNEILRKDRIKKYKKDYYKEHREEIQDYKKEYYKRNRKETLVRVKKYNKKNHQRIKNYKRVYSEKSKARIKAYDKERNRRLREQFFLMYGNKCNCCGETHYGFLTIDHINGQKGLRKKEFGRTAWKKAVDKYRPDLYKILCYNCNNAIRFGEICPHKKGEK